jgi:hypothetical protein
MSPSDLAFASNHQDILTLLDLVVRARYPLIYLVTPEEAPAEELLQVLSRFPQPQAQTLDLGYCFRLVRQRPKQRATDASSKSHRRH